jgi:alpha-L-fucosidase
METTIEEILDQNIKASKQGSVLKNDDKELLELLNVADSLYKLPKKAIPKPAMQRKFMLAPVKILWYSRFHFSKLATVSMSAILLFSAAGATGYAAWHSVPGQALFAIKKSAEGLQLKFAATPEKKATLYMEFSQKRLMDAQKVLNNPNSEPEFTKAAISELINQTKNTVDAVQTITKNESLDKAKPMVNALENITAKQDQLIKEIKPEGNSDIVAKAKESASESATKLAEIKKYIEVATNEQALVNLNGKKEAEKTSEEIKGTSTPDQIQTATSTSATSTTPKIIEKIEEVPKIDPNTVTGSFIIEDPAPQFVP